MKFESLLLYYHYYPRQIKFLFYILFNIVIILSQLYCTPTVLFKYRIINITLCKKPNHVNKIVVNQSIKLNRNKIIKNATSQFPIDLVYTWVDGRDEKWLNEFISANEERKVNYTKKDFLNRFVDIEDIRFSLRSVEKNLPFIRHVFIVTWNKQFPYWLNLSNPRVTIVSQSKIFSQNVKLPTFNSKSIDFMLFKIPGLSEHFIYSNDDMYFGRPLRYSDFFTIDGKPIIYSSQNNWTQISKKLHDFERGYKRTKNDGLLFMASVFYSVYSFKNKFGEVMKYGYSHIPMAFTKKICEEVYWNFKEEIDLTISHRFRSLRDLQMQTMMIQYGLYTNQSVAKLKKNGDALFIVASYNNRNFRRLYRFVHNLPKFLSINIDEMNNREKIKAFLDAAFEEQSSFELKNKPPVVNRRFKELYSDGKMYEFDMDNVVNNIINLYFNFIKYILNCIKKFQIRIKM